MKQLSQNTVAYLVCVLLLLASLSACSKHGAMGGRNNKIDYWTCTMHPSVHAKDPGKCPI